MIVDGLALLAHDRAHADASLGQVESAARVALSSLSGPLLAEEADRVAADVATLSRPILDARFLAGVHAALAAIRGGKVP